MSPVLSRLSPFASFSLSLPVSAQRLKPQVDTDSSCGNPESVVRGGGYLYGLLELLRRVNGNV